MGNPDECARLSDVTCQIDFKGLCRIRPDIVAVACNRLYLIPSTPNTGQTSYPIFKFSCFNSKNLVTHMHIRTHIDIRTHTCVYIISASKNSVIGIFYKLYNFCTLLLILIPTECTLTNILATFLI